MFEENQFTELKLKVTKDLKKEIVAFYIEMTVVKTHIIN